MTYEIGQKVTTPHGDGVIISMSEIDNEYEVEYPYKELTTSFFGIESLQPYKSPHDKLIEMGYVKKINKNTVDYIKETKDTYRRYGNRITIHTKEKLYSGIAFNDDLFNSQYHKSEMAFTIELSRILTQYLEELNGK